MAEVVNLFPDEKYYAECPECGSLEWNLRVNGLGKDWEFIKGSECAECGCFIEWTVIQVQPEEENNNGSKEIDS